MHDVNPFSLSLMLCDFAQAIQGKLYVMGGGWNARGPQPGPLAIAGVIKVPWGETNVNHVLRMALVDANGVPYMIPTPVGEQALSVDYGFNVGRPAGATPGTDFNVPVAINFAVLQLAAGRYQFRSTIGDRGADSWNLTFNVLENWPPRPGG